MASRLASYRFATSVWFFNRPHREPCRQGPDCFRSNWSGSGRQRSTSSIASLLDRIIRLIDVTALKFFRETGLQACRGGITKSPLATACCARISLTGKTFFPYRQAKFRSIPHAIAAGANAAQVSFPARSGQAFRWRCSCPRSWQKGRTGSGCRSFLFYNINRFTNRHGIRCKPRQDRLPLARHPGRGIPETPFCTAR